MKVRLELYPEETDSLHATLSQKSSEINVVCMDIQKLETRLTSRSV